MSMNLEHLGQFLAEAKAYIPAKFEPSIFSIGGRGYYENPTSDLLAFFLRPNGPHGFGDLFLRAFLECAGFSEKVRRLEWVKVSREQNVKSGGRIDLFIQGPDWCLVIETKIWHFQNNPFEEYEKHARSTGKPAHFAILSPDGSSSREGWQGVAFGDYCARLRQLLGEYSSRAPLTKWQVFAAEFVDHVHQECYPQKMRTEQVAFIETHLEQIAGIKKMEQEYRGYLAQSIEQSLRKSIPEAEFFVRDQGWAFRCRSPKWGEPDLVLFQDGERQQQYRVRAYLPAEPVEQLDRVLKQVSGGAFDREPESRKWVRLTSAEGFGTSAEAIQVLVILARAVNEALRG